MGQENGRMWESMICFGDSACRRGAHCTLSHPVAWDLHQSSLYHGDAFMLYSSVLGNVSYLSSIEDAKQNLYRKYDI